MKINTMSNYPIITAEFKNLAELAAVMETSTKTAQRALQGVRPFRITEKRRICAYLDRELTEVFGNV